MYTIISCDIKYISVVGDICLEYDRRKHSDRAKVKGHTKLCPCLISTSYILWFPRYTPDKISKVKVTIARSKVILRSHHDTAHIHPHVNSQYQLPTPTKFLRYSTEKILKVKVPTARSNQGPTIILHKYTSNQYPY